MNVLRGGLWVFMLVCVPSYVRAAPFGDIAVVNGLHALELDDAAGALGHLTPIAGAPIPPGPKPTWTRQQIVARYLAGEAALRLNRDDDALAYLAELDEPLSEVEDLLWVLRGRALLHKEDWGAAKTAWQQVQKASPSDNWRAEASFSLSDIAYGQGDKAQAEHMYHRDVRMLPRHPRAALARLRLAEAAEAQGRFDQAAELLRKVADGRGEALAPVANARLASLQRSGNLSPKSFSSQLTYVDHLLLAHSLQEASVLIDALMPLAQGPVEQEQMAQRRAQLAMRGHDYPQAIAMLVALKEGNAGRPRLTFQRELAQALASSGQTDAALKELDDVAAHLAASKDIRDVTFRAAWLTYEAGRWAEAETRFAAYIQANPRDHNVDEAMWLHAWNAYHRGDFPAGRERLLALQKRFAHSSLSERAEYWLGRIAQQMGDRKEAIERMTTVAQAGTSYYAMLARQRIGEWGGDPNTLPWQRGHLVASLVPMGSADVPPASLARPSEASRMMSTTDMPWEDDVFDWQSELGVRTLRLIQLGHGREAASLVGRLPVVQGSSHERVEYARARLLFGLRDYAAAYRGVGPTFRRAIEQGLAPQTRRYFQLAYPQAHLEIVQAAAQEFRVSPYLLLAVMRQESAYNDGANSQASARGLMQIIPVTGRKIAEVLHEPGYTDAALRSARTSVRFGAWYLGELVRKFDGHMPLAIGSYNAGPQAVTRWAQMRPGEESDVFVEDIGFKETRNYVKHVMANLAMYDLVYRDAQLSMPPSIPVRIGQNVEF